MKTQVLVIFMFACFEFAFAQSLTPKKFYTMNGSKWGYVNEQGEKVIPAKYDEAYPFQNGIAKVGQYMRYGIINEKGEEIIPVKYEKIKDFKDGYAIVKIEDKYGVINEQGKEIVSPKYAGIQDFQNGFAIVHNEHWKYGFINRQGKEVVPLIYAEVKNFTCNRAAIGESHKRGKFDFVDWGFIDTTGKVIVKPIYWEIEPYKYDIAKVIVSRGNGYDYDAGFIDLNGKFILPAKYDKYSEIIKGGYIIAKAEKVALYDKHGKQLLPPEYSFMTKFFDTDYILIIGDNGKGLADTTGRIRLAANFSNISDFSYNNNTLAKVTFDYEGEHFFFINKDIECVEFEGVPCPEE